MMVRHSSLIVTILSLLLISCATGGEPASDIGTPTDEPTIEGSTPFAITASVGTVEPETPVPPDQITPVTVVVPSSTPIPPLPGGLGPSELKYRILAEFPDFFFCDPDYYPVARADEMDLARERFPELQANAEEFDTILAHNNLSGATTFTDDQMLLIYREHKKLNAIYFEVTDAGYRFQIQSAKAEGDGELITGVIDAQGAITIEQREAALVMCPICLAADTLIDTPDGPVAVQDLRVGMLVWTLDASGKRMAQPLIAVGSTVVPASHQVVYVLLDDGRELLVSPGHPTADGRTIGELRAGDMIDGSVIMSAERVLYTSYATYDLLPAGDTGFYWANGILIASTLTD
jgi:hypothetical protein